MSSVIPGGVTTGGIIFMIWKIFTDELSTLVMLPLTKQCFWLHWLIASRAVANITRKLMLPDIHSTWEQVPDFLRLGHDFYPRTMLKKKKTSKCRAKMQSSYLVIRGLLEVDKKIIFHLEVWQTCKTCFIV